MAVLHEVDVDLALALAYHAVDGGDIAAPHDDDPGEQFAECSRLAVGELTCQRQQDVQAARAAGLQETRQVDFAEEFLDEPRDVHHVGERRVLGVEIQARTSPGVPGR